MRILYLSQGRKIEDHPGHHDALNRLTHEGFVENFFNLPCLGYAESHGYRALWREIIRLAKKNRSEIVYFQYFHHPRNEDPRECIEKLKRLPDSPVIVSSSGDPFSVDILPPHYPLSFKQCVQSSDIVFSTQMGNAAKAMVDWGAKYVILLPNSMCQVRFASSDVDLSTHSFDFDVCFIGSKNQGHSPLSRHFWKGRERSLLIRSLEKRYGKKFGLFGHGWDGRLSWQGPILFEDIQVTFRRGRVLVDGNPYSSYDYYSSNRPFFAIATGIPTVLLNVPRLDKVLSPFLHCHYANNSSEIINICDHILDADPKEVYRRSALAAKDITDRHTQYHRMKFLVDVCQTFRESGASLTSSCFDFPYFSSETKIPDEYPYCFYRRS